MSSAFSPINNILVAVSISTKPSTVAIFKSLIRLVSIPASLIAVSIS